MSALNRVGKVALITGSAQRIGAEICNRLHREGWSVIIHYNRSKNEAQELADKLNASAPNSARIVAGDLLQKDGCHAIAVNALNAFGRIDTLINNASTSPTDNSLDDEAAWIDLFRCNTFAPYLLMWMLKTELAKNSGCIVNLLDVRATNLNPAVNWAIYTATKAALHSLTISAAKELAPYVRVNAVSPGITLPFPSEYWDDETANEMKARSLLGTTATPSDVADAVCWLTQSKHVTGQVITVDGGESLRW